MLITESFFSIQELKNILSRIGLGLLIVDSSSLLISQPSKKKERKKNPCSYEVLFLHSFNTEALLGKLAENFTREFTGIY